MSLPMDIPNLCNGIVGGNFILAEVVEDYISCTSNIASSIRMDIADCIISLTNIVKERDFANERCGKFISICSSLDQTAALVAEKVYKATCSFLDWANKAVFQKYKETQCSLKLFFDFVKYCKPNYGLYLLQLIEGDLFESFRCLDPEDGDKLERMLNLYEQIVTKVISEGTVPFVLSAFDSITRFCNELQSDIKGMVPKANYLDEYSASFSKSLLILSRLKFGLDTLCTLKTNGDQIKLIRDWESFWLILTSIGNSSSQIRKIAHQILKIVIAIGCNVNSEDDDDDDEDASFKIPSPLAEGYIWLMCKENVSSWNQYTTILNNLENGQAHITKPLLSKVFDLFADDVHNPLPACWLLALFHRLLTHENRVTQKDGFLMTLAIQPNKLLVNDVMFNWFIRNGLFHALQDSQLYVMNEHADSIHQKKDFEEPIASKLSQFFLRCNEKAVNKSSFVSNLIKGFVNMKWGQVPLVTVCPAIFNLPNDQCIHQNVVITYLKALRSELGTQRVEVRKLVLQTTIEGFIKSPLPQSILDNFLDLLLQAADEKCFRRGTSLYNETARAVLERFSSNKEGFPTIDFLRQELLGSNKHVALCALLILDGLKYTSQTDECGILFGSYLKTIFDTSQQMSTRLYMDNSTIMFVVEFVQLFCRILNEDCDGSGEDFVSEMMVPRAADLFDMVGSLLESSLPSTDRNFISLLLDGVEELRKFSRRYPTCNISHSMEKLKARLIDSMLKTLPRINDNKNLSNNFTFSQDSDQMKVEFSQSPSLRLSSADLIKYSTTWRVCDWCVQSSETGKLNSVFRRDILRHLKLEQTIEKPTSKKDDDDVIIGDWNKEVSEFSRVQFKFLTSVLESCGVQQLRRLDFQHLLSIVTDKFELTSPEDIHVLLTLAKHLIAQILSAPAEVEDDEVTRLRLRRSKIDSVILQTCLLTMWKQVVDLARNSSHKQICKLFVSATFQPLVLESPPLRPTLTDILEQIFVTSSKKPFLMTLVARKFIPDDVSVTWKWGVTSSAFDLVEYFVRMLSFSSAPSKDSVLFYEMVKSFKRYNDDAMLLTSHNVAFVASLDEDKHFKFGNKLFNAMLQHDVAICKEKHRSLHNSMVHHRRYKIWSCLVILHKFVTSEESESIIELIIKQLSKEMQPSVRHLGEWLFALLLVRFPSHIALLRKELAKPISDKKRVLNAINSNLIVGLLYGKSKLTEETWIREKQYLLDLVNDVLPWCMNQQFSIRLHAQAILLEINNLFKKFDDLSSLEKTHPCIESCLRFADCSSGNVQKNWMKIKKSFIIFHLHPVVNLSLETLLVDVPRLCLMSPHMCFDVASLPHIFDQSRNKFPVETDKLYGLSSLRTDWLPSNLYRDDDRFRLSSPEQQQEGESNAQTKIELTSKNEGTKKIKSGLILIASLLEKTANLGGLTRTSEIFGASRIVVNNKSCVDDKTFQSLAVSAHKWIEIEQVRKNELGRYLLRMRNTGYTLVGVEQTKNSISLDQYKFAPRTCLLLGNEREGIPNDLLHILHDCVEIPQNGLIRSLNVHVSGAISVWEFTKQNNLNRK